MGKGIQSLIVKHPPQMPTISEKQITHSEGIWAAKNQRKRNKSTKLSLNITLKIRSFILKIIVTVLGKYLNRSKASRKLMPSFMTSLNKKYKVISSLLVLDLGMAQLSARNKMFKKVRSILMNI